MNKLIERLEGDICDLELVPALIAALQAADRLAGAAEDIGNTMAWGPKIEALGDAYEAYVSLTQETPHAG